VSLFSGERGTTRCIRLEAERTPEGTAPHAVAIAMPRINQKSPKTNGNPPGILVSTKQTRLISHTSLESSRGELREDIFSQFGRMTEKIIQKKTTVPTIPTFDSRKTITSCEVALPHPMPSIGYFWKYPKAYAMVIARSIPEPEEALLSNTELTT